MPRERGGGEEEHVSMSSSWPGYRRRGRCASSARSTWLASCWSRRAIADFVSL